MNKSFYYAAAVTTGIAGILHLTLAYNLSHFGISNFSIFFLIAGIPQLFWVGSMAGRWGKPWYYVGMGGTIVLIIIWTITRFPNPLTEGRGLPINSMSIVTDLFEIAFVITTAIIISKERSKRAPEIKQNVR
ncbi:MAG TPA: hypothetical protein VEP90_21095 [Methylomirabilota bacterium]|nr:hypothetical protein [Methylomirabilota bacterium]